MGSTTTNGKNHVLPIDSGTPTEPKRRIPVNYALRILFASFENLQICFVLNRCLGSRIIKLDKKTRTIKMSLLTDDPKQEIFIAINEIEIFGSLSGLNLNWK